MKERTKTLQPRRTASCPVTGTRATLAGMPLARPRSSIRELRRPETEQLGLGLTCVVALAARSWSVLERRGAAAVRARRTTRSGSACRNGRLHPIHRGVYAVGHANLPLEGCFLAAVKACGPGAPARPVSRPACSREDRRWDHRLPEVLVLGPRRGGTDGSACIARDGVPAAEDIADPPGHPGDLTAARTLLDLAGDLDYAQLRRAVREAQALGWSSSPSSRAAARARAAPRRGQRCAGSSPPARRRRGSSSRTSSSTSCSRGGIDAPRRQRAARHRRPQGDAGLPLAGAAARGRGGRRRLARQPARPRGRRGAPGAAGGRAASASCASRWEQAVGAARRPCAASGPPAPRSSRVACSGSARVTAARRGARLALRSR